MAEKKVPYQVNGKPFEGMIVYDDVAAGKRPATFMQPDWRAFARHHRAGTHRRRRRPRGADGGHVWRRLWRQAEGAGRVARRHARRAQRPALHPRLRRRRLRRALCRSGQARPGRCRQEPRDRLLRRRRLRARAGAHRRRFQGVVVFHVTNPNPVVAGTPCNIRGRVLAIHGSADPVTPKP